MLLLALRLHEDAISECMSKICDGGQEWKVDFGKVKKASMNVVSNLLNRLCQEVTFCLFAWYYYFFISKITSNGRASS